MNTTKDSLTPSRLCTLTVDVAQSVRTGPVESTSRGIAIVGVTSRVVSRGHADGPKR